MAKARAGRPAFTPIAARTILMSVPASSAMWTMALVSLGRQLPPKPKPAWRNLDPMRLSRPMDLATSRTSAPTASARRAISLMKEIFTARKLLDAYLMSSAVSMLVFTMGVSSRNRGR